MIYDVLIDKREKLLKVGDPLAVEFGIRDINILSDLSQLRVLKLKTPFPDDYKIANDVFECANKRMHGDTSIYRVLEFCMLRNRVLQHNVIKVFSGLERED